jgi:diketogulonate reductase-like aldo/keto reductase
MRRETFGPTGARYPVVGLGTWQMEHDDRASAIRALRRGIELGATHVDTAELYGRGRVEEMVAEALLGLRDRVELVSKVLPQNASRRGVVAACEASLRRLRTDRLDGYLLHWDGPHPLEETVAGFEELAHRGLIRWWGVSNFDELLLDRVVAIAGPGRVACDQVLYHLGERRIEHRVLPACRRHGVALVAYSPFGSGAFPTPGSPGGRALARVGARRGSTPRQVALAFLSRDPDLFVLPKSSDPGRTEENVRAGDLRLSAEDVAELHRAFPVGPWTPELPTL